MTSAPKTPGEGAYSCLRAQTSSKPARGGPSRGRCVCLSKPQIRKPIRTCIHCPIRGMWPACVFASIKIMKQTLPQNNSEGVALRFLKNNVHGGDRVLLGGGVFVRRSFVRSFVRRPCTFDLTHIIRSKCTERCILRPLRHSPELRFGTFCVWSKLKRSRLEPFVFGAPPPPRVTSSVRPRGSLIRFPQVAYFVCF